MENYYKPDDLPKFEEIGKEAPDLAKKFFDYYIIKEDGAPFMFGENKEAVCGQKSEKNFF